jgi:hypothetical protein
MPRQRISRFALALALLHLGFCIIALTFGDHTVWWAFDYLDWPASILFNALREVAKDLLGTTAFHSWPSTSFPVGLWIDSFLFLGLGSLWYFIIGWCLHRFYRLLPSITHHEHV